MPVGRGRNDRRRLTVPLAFRNLDLTPEAPVEEWPVEAILTAIERGSLAHWRRVVASIRREPWGTTARRTESALELTDAYGITPVLRRAIARARADADLEERAAVANRIRELVDASGMGRTEFASQIGTSPSRLSTYATGKVVPSAALLLRMERVAQKR